MDGFVVISQAISRTVCSPARDGTSVGLNVSVINIIASGRQVVSIFDSDASTLFPIPVRRSEVLKKLLENVPRVYANQAFAVLTALYKYLDTRCNLRPWPEAGQATRQVARSRSIMSACLPIPQSAG